MPTKKTATKPAPKAPEKPATGTVKVKRANLRGWAIIPAADVRPKDVVLARYP